MMVGGEGSGKSLVGAMEMVSRVFEGKLFWLVGADYDNTKPEFDYIVEAAQKLGILEFASQVVNPGKIVLSGGITISTISAKDPRNISKYSPHGIVVCEAAQCDFQVIQRLIARLGRAGEGGWMLMTGTFEGCLTGDTLVATSRGLLTIDEVAKGDTVCGLEAKTPVLDSWSTGTKEIVTVGLSKGYSISGTPNHKVIIRRANNKEDWEELDKITDRDLVAIRYDTQIYGTEDVDKEYAWLAGFYLADGCWDRDYNRLSFATKDQEIIDRLAQRGYVYSERTCQTRKTDNELADIFTKLGIDRNWKAGTKQIPSGILKANKETIVAFLRGLFDGDGCVTEDGRVCYYTISSTLANQLHVLLLNLGIVSTLTDRKERGFELYIGDYHKFSDTIGFRLQRKQKRIDSLPRTKHSHPNNYNCRYGFYNGYPVVWCKLVSKESSRAKTYDLTTNCHAFWANGLVAHNSLGWYP